jgi:hypothetical protein
MWMNPRGVHACMGRGHALPESRSSVLAPARKRHDATRRGRGQVPAQKKSNQKVGGAYQCVWPTEHVKSERGHVSVAMQTRLRSDQVCCQATRWEWPTAWPLTRVCCPPS